MTNFERIKQASAEEIAELIVRVDDNGEFLSSMMCKHICRYSENGGCVYPQDNGCAITEMSYVTQALEWLKSDVWEA